MLRGALIFSVTLTVKRVPDSRGTPDALRGDLYTIKRDSGL